MKTKKRIKFLLLSTVGVVLFFVPVYQSKVPVALLIELFKSALGASLGGVAVLSSLTLAVTLVAAKIFKVKTFERYYAGDGPIKLTFFIVSIVLVALTAMQADISFIRRPEIGGKILQLASTVFLTIALAGTLVIFIIKSGVVEFVSVLLEDIMRPIFKLPGEAAINMISSFVSSASVGVYITEQYYIKKTYTTKQACAVVTNFSVISVGYIGVLASIVGLEDQYGTLLICSFLLVLIMAAIMVRIPPLAAINSLCIDGAEQQNSHYNKIPWKQRLHLAIEQGTERAQEFTMQEFAANFAQALKFAQKTIGVMVPTVMLVLTLVYYTPIFEWLGYPLVPIIRLLGIPDAAAVAPSVLIGIVEVSLPSILVAGGNAAAQSRFFVVLLSIVQIIFFSEAGNAILSSKIPLKAGRLIQIFLTRTLIAMPLVAILSHILF